MINKVTTEKQEEQMVHLVRNALLVAGQEMDDGDQPGDHWPVIKSTIHSIMLNWEALKIDRNVDNEVQKHCLNTIKELEAMRNECTSALRQEIDDALTEMREVYDACFTETAPENITLDPDMISLHVKRAHNIIQTLETTDE